MKRRYFNRKRNFTAAFALLWAAFFSLFGLVGYIGILRCHAPVYVAVPVDIFLGLSFGYGHGLAMYYLGRLRWGDEFYE